MSRTAQSTRRPPDYTNGLPTDPHAESIVLGCILTGQLPLDAVAAGDFQDPRHRFIFQQIGELQKASRPIDAATVAKELDRCKKLQAAGGAAYVDELRDLPEIIHPERYIDRIKDKALRRVIIHHADNMATGAMRDNEPVDNLIVSGADFYRDLHTKNGHSRESQPSLPSWPEPLGEDAYHGLAGELVRLILPHTEGDPAALLVQFLAAWGSMAGRGPYYLVEGDYHHTNLYVVLVGASSKGRKGTSWGRVRAVLTEIDEHWTDNCVIRGLGSGEGLIDVMSGENPDKRCLIQEAEFARILSVISRDGTTLSPILRDAYDGGSLAIRTRLHKIPPIKGGHVSVIAHVTRDELRRRLNDSEIANGFANRMLWVCAARSKELPEGGGSPNLDQVIKQIKEATDFTRRLGNTRVRLDEAAQKLWREIYHDLSSARPGLLGEVTNRMEANTIRMSLIYALLDKSDKICEPHLRAGLAVVSKYCFDSARFIWGDALGDPTADEILRALKASSEGLTRWDLHNHFGRHKGAGEIDRAINVLAERGLLRSAKEETGGRDSTRYRAA